MEAAYYNLLYDVLKDTTIAPLVKLLVLETTKYLFLGRINMVRKNMALQD